MTLNRYRHRWRYPDVWAVHKKQQDNGKKNSSGFLKFWLFISSITAKKRLRWPLLSSNNMTCYFISGQKSNQYTWTRKYFFNAKNLFPFPVTFPVDAYKILGSTIVLDFFLLVSYFLPENTQVHETRWILFGGKLFSIVHLLYIFHIRLLFPFCKVMILDSHID